MLFDRTKIDKVSVISFEILTIIFYDGRRKIMGTSATASRCLSRRQMNRDYFLRSVGAMSYDPDSSCDAQKYELGQIHWTHFSREECSLFVIVRQDVNDNIPPHVRVVPSSSDIFSRFFVFRWFFFLHLHPATRMAIFNVSRRSCHWKELSSGGNEREREREVFYRDSSRVPCYRECSNSHGLSQCKKLRFLPR